MKSPNYFVLQNGKVIAECYAQDAADAYARLAEHFPDRTKRLCLVVGKQEPVSSFLPRQLQ